jgi:hypothetical protein
MRALADSLSKKGVRVHVLTNYFVGSEGYNNCFAPKDSALEYDKYGSWIGFLYRVFRKLGFFLFGIKYHLHYRQFINQNYCENNFDGISAVIVSTPQPEFIEVGVSLSLAKKCKLILDFRDGLTFEPLAQTDFFTRFINKRIEQKGIELSDLVISVSDALTEDFKQRFPTTKKKYITVTNGYLDDKPTSLCKPFKLNSYIDENKVNIVFSGNIGLSRKSIYLSLLTFSNAIKLLTQEEIDSLKISFIGNFLPNEELLIKNFGTLYSPVSRTNIRKIQQSSDYLLLLTGPDRSVVTMKLFDYLAARRPILSIGNAPTPQRILKETNAGCQFSLHQQDKIAHKLSSLTKTKMLSFEPIQKYSLGCLMDLLAKLILDVIDDQRK